MGKRGKSFILGICFLLTASISGQKIYEIDTLYPVHSLDHVLQVFPDSLDVFTPEQIIKDSTSLYLKGDQLPQYLQVGTTYWGRLNLKAKQSLAGWTLHLQDRMIGPPAWAKSNGKVDVFGYLGDSLLFHRKTGVEYAKKERNYKKNWAINAVYLNDIPVDERISLILKVQGNALGYPSYFNLTARSPNQPFYHEFNQFHASFNIFLFGVTFIIFLYHLLQFLYLKEKVTFWFGLWLLFCATTQGMTVGLMPGNATPLRYVFWFMIAHGMFYTFWFFGRAFVDSQTKYPRLDAIMKWLAIGVMFIVVLTVLYILFFDAEIFFTAVGFHYAVLMVYFGFSFLISINLVLKKDHFARYFGIGSLVGCLAFFVGTLWSMRIIRPPFSLDPFAMGIFMQVILYSFGIAYRRQTLAKQAQLERILAERSNAEMRRMKDLDTLKSRFFTNISHELRTPLTLIQGPIEQASKRQSGGRIQLRPKDFNIVQRNSKRLQNLVDELLELSSLETGKVRLSLTYGNLISIIKPMVYSFESMAEMGITLKIDFQGKEKEGYFDAGRLEKIISNLLSNALKYTPNGGGVTVKVDVNDEELECSIKDTGRGIDKEDLPHVFDRFYRVEGSEEKGSGIGLALTKELVQLHQGRLDLKSELGVGTTINVRLPITLEKLPSAHYKKDRNDTLDAKKEVFIENEAEKVVPEDSNLPMALVVEDNADLRTFIATIISTEYHVLFANHGQEGVSKALEYIPDIIVSDVMMPNMNGFELCHELKSNIKTSHIPVILLTAKAGQNNKMEGLQYGADVYLTKPFDADELLLRMKNLRAVQERLWQKIKSTDGILVDNLELTSLDDDFIKKVFQTIEEHLEDSDFTVELMAREVGFSRGQLHRKIKAILDIGPNQLITDVRLNKAHEFLKKKAGSVSEIAYGVGFSNLSYFSKRFREKFGFAPSELPT